MHAQKESDELCDGDSADDKEVESETDKADDIVDDHGFGTNSKLWAGVQTKVEEKSVAQLKKESEELCDGDSADDKETEDEFDPEDGVVDDHGFGRNWVQLGSTIRMTHHHKKPHNLKNLQSKYDVTAYSDELANGDSADNRDIHEEEDMNDDVVDFNG